MSLYEKISDVLEDLSTSFLEEKRDDQIARGTYRSALLPDDYVQPGEKEKKFTQEFLARFEQGIDRIFAFEFWHLYDELRLYELPDGARPFDHLRKEFGTFLDMCRTDNSDFPITDADLFRWYMTHPREMEGVEIISTDVIWERFRAYWVEQFAITTRWAERRAIERDNDDDYADEDYQEAQA